MPARSIGPLEQDTVSVSTPPAPSRSAGVVVPALGSALMFAATVLPALDQSAALLGLVALVSPVPLAVARLRGGLRHGLVSAGLASALVGLAFGGAVGLVFAGGFAAPGLLLAEPAARGRGLVRGCGWAFLLLAAELGALLLVMGPSAADPLLEPIAHYRSSEFLEQLGSGGLPPEHVVEWERSFAHIHDALEVVYPAAYLIGLGLSVLANAWLLRAYLARRAPGFVFAGEFERVRWPLGLVVAFCVAGVAVTLPPIRPAAYNVLLLVAFFFALQGLAVVTYYAFRLAGPPLLRGALVVLVLLNPWAPQLLALLGLFDTWFDFRRFADPSPGGSEGGQ